MTNDEVIQKAFGVLPMMKWRNCEEDDAYEWYYAENNYYVIRHKHTDAYWCVKQKSPSKALECIKRKMNDG